MVYQKLWSSEVEKLRRSHGVSKVQNFRILIGYQKFRSPEVIMVYQKLWSSEVEKLRS